MPKANHRQELNRVAGSGTHSDASSDLDSQAEAVRCFARELGRLLGRQIAHVGFPPDKNAIRSQTPQACPRTLYHKK